MKIDDRLFSPLLQPKVPGNPSVMFVHLSVVLSPFDRVRAGVAMRRMRAVRAELVHWCRVEHYAPCHHETDFVNSPTPGYWQPARRRPRSQKNAQGNWFDNGIAQALAKNHRVVALDNRNHGKSDILPKRFSADVQLASRKSLRADNGGCQSAQVGGRWDAPRPSRPSPAHERRNPVDRSPPRYVMRLANINRKLEQRERYSQQRFAICNPYRTEREQPLFSCLSRCTSRNAMTTESPITAHVW